MPDHRRNRSQQRSHHERNPRPRPPEDPAPTSPIEIVGTGEGVLELDAQGAGFLRSPKRHLLVHADDPYVSADAIRKFALRGGEFLGGPLGRVDNKGNRRFKLARIEMVDGVPATEWLPPTPLAETTAIDPDEQLHFDTPGGPVTMRVVDLFTPIGKGQRGLIVAPPRTGKTILLQQMAHGIATNHPEIYMIVLLIDERPEEVTEMRRNVRGEVVASSNDQDVNSHIRVARLVIERAPPARGGRQTHRHPARFDHAAGARVQRLRGQQRPDDDRRPGYPRAAGTQADLRGRPGASSTADR